MWALTNAKALGEASGDTLEALRLVQGLHVAAQQSLANFYLGQAHTPQQFIRAHSLRRKYANWVKVRG